MIVDACQRWREGRSGFVLRSTAIDPARFCVRVVRESEARAFVVDHHYSGSFPAARACAGLFRDNKLVGAIVLSEPMQSRAVPKHTGIGEGAELGRLVLLDDVEANGETWFAKRAIAAIRSGGRDRQIQTVLSYSDPVERASPDGSIAKPGHVGTIYQAMNAHYRGLTGDRTEYFAGGSRISGRALSKIRLGETGADYAIGQLIARGAPPPTGSPALWLLELERSGFVTRARRSGNHAYVIPLTRRAKAASRGLPRLPYPKLKGLAA